MDLIKNQHRSIQIHRLLPFSNVEGIGNRCSIFVQGCNLNCEYCHNRETISMVSESAKYLTIDEIVSFVKQSMPFIRGLTVSGGEPTLYASQLMLLFNEVHKLGLSCYIDTNGFFDYEKTENLIRVTDKFLFDIKGDNSGLIDLCFSSKNSENKLFDESTPFNNLQQLLNLDKIEEVRFVYIKNRLREEEVIEKIATILNNYQSVPLKIIPVHTKGLDQQHRSAIIKDVPTDNDVQKLRDLAFSLGVKHVI
jgi:pyruvate formate lyase activating enzyme